jgi:hypothetical protein
MRRRPRPSLADTSFVISIPVLYLGGASTMGLFGPNRGVLLACEIVSSACLVGGLLGAAWSAFAGRAMRSGVAAIVCAALTLVLSAWAFEVTGEHCPAGQHRDGLVCQNAE